MTDKLLHEISKTDEDFFLYRSYQQDEMIRKHDLSIARKEGREEMLKNLEAELIVMQKKWKAMQKERKVMQKEREEMQKNLEAEREEMQEMQEMLKDMRKEMQKMPKDEPPKGK
jgi:septal ring factor EnvC (AmiA/AmiB activator)